ncbi:MAG TPA: poly-gamma-glutamate system protein [Pirellulales bacterium]|jgi:poly-gamma-glutamate system protein|nr:poly-gamma-glutamate system protein [Pirellulales bacterium]
MKSVYWQPHRAGRPALVVMACLSIGGLLLVESHRRRVPQPDYDEKVAAAQLAADCMETIKQRRIALGHAIDPAVDPAQTGLIGAALTPATSTAGRLKAKRVSANPNFAAIVVALLKRAGVEKGDTVAIGYSGSFPGLNIAVESAVQTLDLRPIGISSAAASQWGANLPDFLWLDMERTLYDEGKIGFRSQAASLGGVEDRGLGMSDETQQTLRAGIARNGLATIEAESFTQSVEQRMRLYQDQAGGRPIKCYINIGGGATSVGKSLGKKQFRSGLHTRLPRRARTIDSVMTRFLAAGVPVIHLIRATAMAERYGLETEPRAPAIVGQGEVFERYQYNAWYAAAALAGILAMLGFLNRWSAAATREPSLITPRSS